MPDVVNNALALAQFICEGRSEEQAVTFLLALEGLSIDCWRVAKRELSIDDTTNHRTKEGFIKQIVNFLKNDDKSDINYCLKDLSLCPGFSKESIELVFFSSATVNCIRTVSANIARAHTRAAHQSSPPSRSNNSVVQQEHTHEPSSSPAQPQRSETIEPVVATAELREFPPLTHDTNTAGNNTDNTPPAPPSGQRRWENKGHLRYKAVDKKKDDVSSNKKWIYGSSPSTDSQISHQLRFVCLGVRSGAEETVESLTNIITKWNCVKDLKVEPVRKSHYSSTFRVQYKIPVSLISKWKESNIWPTRCWVAEWRGDPKKALSPLNERVHKMRIYVGNISHTATEEMIVANVKEIYKTEIQHGEVTRVEAIVNQTGLEMARKRHSQDPTHVITKSACVILSSPPGKDLSEIGMKLDHYPHNIRRTVRRWNGPLPHSNKEPMIHLEW